ncbi:MAG: hypothetical protein ACJA0E_000900 [Bermanella sp.]|jgi:hypothetical protein
MYKVLWLSMTILAVFIGYFIKGMSPDNRLAQAVHMYAINDGASAASILGKCITGINSGYAIYGPCGISAIAESSFDNNNIKSSDINGVFERWEIAANLKFGAELVSFGMDGNWVSGQIRTSESEFNQIPKPNLNSVLELQNQCSNVSATDELYIYKVVSGCSFTDQVVDSEEFDLEAVELGFNLGSSRARGEMEKSNNKLSCKTPVPILVKAVPVRDICRNTFYKIAGELISSHRSKIALEEKLIGIKSRASISMRSCEDKLTGVNLINRNKSNELAMLINKNTVLTKACENKDGAQEISIVDALKKMAECDVNRSQLKDMSIQLDKERSNANTAILSNVTTLTNCNSEKRYTQRDLNYCLVKNEGSQKIYITQSKSLEDCKIKSAVSEKEAKIYKEQLYSASVDLDVITENNLLGN